MRVSFGVIGCGGYGRILAEAIHRSSHALLTAVADLDEARALALSQSTGARVVSPVDLPRDPHVSVTVVATPNDQHEAPAIAALEAGKSVLVEKPLALRREGLLAILTAAQESVGTLSVGHVERTLPGVLRLEDLVRRGELGRIFHARASRLRKLHRGTSEGAWKWDSSRSGGEIAHEIHEVDLICWLIGEPVATSTLFESGPAESPTTHELTITFENGAVGTVVVGSHHSRPEWQISLFGAAGALHVDFLSATVQHWNDGQLVDSWSLLGDPEMDADLVAAMKLPQRYGSAGGEPHPWMRHAVQLEIDHIVAAHIDGTRNVLAEAPATAALAVASSKRVQQ